MKTYSFSIAALFLLFSVSVDAGWPEGNWYWPTTLGRNVLKFGADNNLVFQSYHTVAGEKKFYSLFGVWNYQLGSCWSSDKQEVNEGTTAGGSLVLYIDSTQCCLNATPLDNKLVLTKVWVKGSSLAVHAYCSDNILIPFEPSND